MCGKCAVFSGGCSGNPSLYHERMQYEIHISFFIHDVWQISTKETGIRLIVKSGVSLSMTVCLRYKH